MESALVIRNACTSKKAVNRSQPDLAKEAIACSSVGFWVGKTERGGGKGNGGGRGGRIKARHGGSVVAQGHGGEQGGEGVKGVRGCRGSQGGAG